MRQRHWGVPCRRADFPLRRVHALSGAAALPPCLGAVALIWGNQPSDGSPRTRIAELLSLRPVVFVGLISSSLYLLALASHGLCTVLENCAPSVWSKPILVACITVLSFLSWRFVERPFRSIRTSPTRNWSFSRFLIVTACLLVDGWSYKSGEGYAGRFPNDARGILELYKRMLRAAFTTTLFVRTQTLPKLTVICCHRLGT